MKSTPTEALKSELNIAPVALILEDLQQMEAIKIYQKNCGCIKTNIAKTTNRKQTTPLMHLTSLCKLFIHVSKTHKLDIEQIVIPQKILSVHEVFLIPNLKSVLPNEREYRKEQKQSPRRDLRQIHVNIYIWIYTRQSRPHTICHSN